MTDSITSADGTRIAFDDLGAPEAPAVIHILGATAYRRVHQGAAAVSELSGLRVLVYDRRGRGESGDAAEYAVEREIEDIAALIAHAGGRAILLGESSGAILALEAALAGLPIDAVVAFEPPVIVDDSRPPLPSDYVATLDALAAAGDRRGMLRYFSIAAVGLPPAVADQMLESPYSAAVEPVAHTIRYDARIAAPVMTGDPRALERYRRITAPVRLLVGESTFPSIRAGAVALAEAIPNAVRVEVPGGDHALPSADAARVLRELAGS